MVAKRKLTIESLSKLGRRKLAELLIAEAAGNHQLTQTLNLKISAEEGPAALEQVSARAWLRSPSHAPCCPTTKAASLSPNLMGCARL